MLNSLHLKRSEDCNLNLITVGKFNDATDATEDISITTIKTFPTTQFKGCVGASFGKDGHYNKFPLPFNRFTAESFTKNIKTSPDLVTASSQASILVCCFTVDSVVRSLSILI
jgi:hypothetical protein